MAGRLRNGKKYLDDNDENIEFNNSNSDSNKSIEQQHQQLEYEYEEENSIHMTKGKFSNSPHTKLRNIIKNDLKDIQADYKRENNENINVSIQKR